MIGSGSSGNTPIPWTAQVEGGADSRCLHFGIQLQGRPLTRKEAFQLWATDDGFRDFQTSLIADAPMQCLRWETPGIQSSGLENPFEFVLLDSPYLDVPASPIDFQEHFRQAEGRDVLRFPNLGGDALMVVPTPRPQIPINAYAHLAAFARSAPREQQHALWKEIGAMMLEQVGDTPLWLSTAGGGVDWLHVRLDTRPKYYGYEPYRSG